LEASFDLSPCSYPLSTRFPLELQRALLSLNRARLAPSYDPPRHRRSQLQTELELRLLEHEFVTSEIEQVQAWAERAPRDPHEFVAWFANLAAVGPGQGDALFPWLAQHASLAQMRWFLRQEMAGEAGFDDLVALTQLQFPSRAKLELARNYWDEMGQGTESAMHGPMLARLGESLALEPCGDDTVWEALALANMMVALASNRHYAYQSIGALGVIELTAPGRSEQVNAGLKRLGVQGEARRYYALHARLDIKHSLAWNREVLYPLVERDPACAPAIAQGALLRLRAGARCFDRYRAELGCASIPLQPSAAH
jgi:hypothetical protein